MARRMEIKKLRFRELITTSCKEIPFNLEIENNAQKNTTIAFKIIAITLVMLDYFFDSFLSFVSEAMIK